MVHALNARTIVPTHYKIKFELKRSILCMNSLDYTKTRWLVKGACFEVLQKKQVTCPVYFLMRNPKLVSDLKSDLDNNNNTSVVQMSILDRCFFGAPQTTRRRLCNDNHETKKVNIVSYSKHSDTFLVLARPCSPIPANLLSFVYIVCLQEWKIPRQRKIMNVTNACGEATRDGETTGGYGCHDVRSRSFFAMPPFSRALLGR